MKMIVYECGACHVVYEKKEDILCRHKKYYVIEIDREKFQKFKEKR